ncbi:MAG: biotin--[acetyl-CoA-carboxylase] ligase [Pseudomonadota bacterium]
MSSFEIKMVEQTGSTNADLADRVRAGQARDGQWLVARRQNAGRGRQGREWFDGTGNFMGSTTVELLSGDPPPASVSFVAALVVYDAVGDILADGARPSLKWPNDVLIGRAKLAGILLEMVKGHLVVGIGVNLARAPSLEDRDAVSLADFGPAPAVDSFAQTLAHRFEERLKSWREHGLAATLAEFELCSIQTPGAPVKVHDQDGSFVEGVFAGLDETDGALRLRLADGSERVIRAGDIV